MTTRTLDIIDEIRARDPGFFDHNIVVLDDQLFDPAGSTGSAGPCTGDPVREIMRKLDESGVKFCRTAGDVIDPISQEIVRGFRDHASLTVARSDATESRSIHDILDADYQKIDPTNDRIGAFVGRREGRPLLLINALGLPLRTWARLLGDPGVGKVIVPVSPSYDLLAGGMTSATSAAELADALCVLLDGLGFDTADVLAWCNGGRVAMELADRRGPSAIGKLVLLSPTFRGGVTPSRRTSAYEDTLHKLFTMVSDVKSRALSVSTILGMPQPQTDWQQFADQPEKRAWQLFGMPRQAFSTDLTVPMATSESLIHYIERTYRDEQISAEFDGTVPGHQVVLIQGTHDSIVDNTHTREWLDQIAPGSTCYEVSGAGHYIHDLQYPYLIELIRRTRGNSSSASLPARISRVPMGESHVPMGESRIPIGE